MRPLSRVLSRAVAAAVCALLPAGIAATSCGTDAVGVTACREIEYARCAAAPLCTQGFNTAECERFYYNFCLVGVQDLEAGADPNTLWGPCVTAIGAVADCVNAPASSVTCHQLIPDASCLEVDAGANACNIILDCPEVLPACAFVAAPVTDAGDAASTTCTVDTNCATGEFCFGGTCGVFSTVAAGASGVSTAGGNTTCGLTSGGGVLCWGQNADGELGNGNTTDSATAVATTLTTGVTAMATANQHSCAISAGAVQCWGDNASGDLGNNATTPSNSPVPVANLTAVTAIALGAAHSCAIKAGTVWCWGANESGELGNDTTTASAIPVQVSGLSAVSDIAPGQLAAGYEHACAISGGGVQCWGNNGTGQLGNDSTTNSSVPVAVTNLTSGVIAIGAGVGHSCAITSAGAVMCWGWNNHGELGNGTTTDSATPVAVSGITSGATALALGDNFTCALVAGGVQCWGNGASGQLGNGATDDSSTPVMVSGLTSGVTSIAAGEAHVCAVVNSAVQCWGSDSNGQLGDGNTNTQSSVPVVSTVP